VVNGQTVGLCPQFTFSSWTNRITTSGYTYDAAGNVTNDSMHAYTWDAEGRISTVDASSTATHTYDALGRRVEAVVGGNPEYFYIYDPAGNLLGLRQSAVAVGCPHRIQPEQGFPVQRPGMQRIALVKNATGQQ
jgi:uncharacterized protein RhaS with RHS repeats